MDYADLDDRTLLTAVPVDRDAAGELLRRYGAGLRELALAAGARSGVDPDRLILSALVTVISSGPALVNGRSFWSVLEAAVTAAAAEERPRD